MTTHIKNKYLNRILKKMGAFTPEKLFPTNNTISILKSTLYIKGGQGDCSSSLTQTLTRRAE